MKLPSRSRQFRAAPVWIVPLILTALVLSGCNRKNEFAAPPPVTVTVTKPVQKAVTDYVEYTGTVEAVESVEVRARVEGYLESIRFKPGARVKQGDLLFVIDPRPFQAKLEEAKAELARRQAELKHTEANMQKKEMALKVNAVSEIEVIQARADYEMTKAAIQAALAAIQTAELNLSYTKIRAAVSGRISRNLVDVGNLVGATERTLLATIVNDDPVYVYFNVNERDLLNFQQGRDSGDAPTSRNGKLKVFLGLSNQEGYPFEGHIDYMDNRLSQSTGTIQVRGVFANSDHRLLPGLFARIQSPIAHRESALLAPDSAVGSDQRGDYLLVVNSQNVVEYRPVITGALIGNDRVIESGISAEDRLIVSGLQRAMPGLTVNPAEAQAKPPSPDAPQAPPK
jgi:RND family efflux transporter MFP subunit